eukprot:CAMPEP_0117665006 /NCGR_PEP_ID=MMETSP0804-20121206/9558_1 /TAXON_ID=1074897 /ORGANISM="Tetraselmis astigmatica, Strain CCMP880" /LENGTH=168 /DNA_ID=CAMNT_0005472347 /DNA_START=259 /DNA_END=765 /DNA_ORIENTATION=+
MRAMEGLTTGLLVVLQVYFLLMNVTVERTYCLEPMSEGDTRFLMQETWDFCSQHNRLFLSRPEWMRAATCMSAYGFCWGYLAVLVAALTGAWKRLAVPLLLFVGAKAYALGFYHYMEFSHPTLAPATASLVPYFSIEGPYLLSMALVLHRVSGAMSGGDSRALKAKTT